ncbi:single-stranded DNA-binding protein [Desertibacillus haloalkaliphilus]|uniref:single-stranded DNA-binding protein n=1 Tax=Desertibacillus haloalkaliphilus TaxID=1328930 RepID=UPI001C258BE4|nr:single-stranded DNA-binding protein [Desertibacillus haloalkaliphilus]MBU8908543.1 single-stranded DNA-binding protein [Desertibacillus haloalkaliphilus]
MINRVILVGRLTRDPELKYTPNGVAVANFTLAVNRPFSNQQGEREADFINVVVWRKQAENATEYLKKGSLAGVDGRFQSRSYENNNGQKVFVVELVAESVQFLEPKSSNGSGGNQNNNQGSRNGIFSQNDLSHDPFTNNGQPIDIKDDDLPFNLADDRQCA